VKRLGLTGSLAKTLETTNPVDNLNGGRITGRVKRCRGGQVALRWVATSAAEFSPHFRRLKGYEEMPKLLAGSQNTRHECETRKCQTNSIELIQPPRRVSTANEATSSKKGKRRENSLAARDYKCDLIGSLISARLAAKALSLLRDES